MKISEIYSLLDSLAPFSDQESWDNSGLLIGSFGDNFDEIVLSLDLDTNLIKNAKQNTLFITHHPLIFKGLKSINPDKFPSNLISLMIKKDIKLISMHTNFDLHLLNRYVLSEVLGYKDFIKDGFILKFDVNKSFDEFASEIRSKLKLPNLRVVKANSFIKNAAFCTGSGADLIGSFEADCFISGDFKYHTALEALENSLSLIDMGHFESERYFGDCLAIHLQKNGLFATITNSINPFTYYEGKL
ncbi:metal-binding protein [Campylobacter hyointestinalis]|uniref:GTP cyclohydrolase 1 type 2 homolog n=1 Tax=Campylobacter hyointestinalis subsp. hyointestinalis TaxID=91352 RepID=A0A9W5AV37_CAMHY|nr:Nif3-like dinuclear metal center hexameric protein [Campylobacter hyointestinalis]PPB51570.1 Nif3-like dinuclear metal center hexameric protein [Campylobacter hyointestinalis subsp. hyointestinalis]PPB54074.1 Nif3-like dinuclear metal center hexameric protein [Campylobacter hyointestinalis subsp. hyointestinalis]PPB58846.1 Nif3-like dinuclear metal center hexameric protein [Campylobacter hyointestinalis subsp. hyointestinalis]PPB62715.1 Nif3-like dinuclear metal center hexameric protein [Cam